MSTPEESDELTEGPIKLTFIKDIMSGRSADSMTHLSKGVIKHEGEQPQ